MLFLNTSALYMSTFCDMTERVCAVPTALHIRHRLSSGPIHSPYDHGVILLGWCLCVGPLATKFGSRHPPFLFIFVEQTSINNSPRRNLMEICLFMDSTNPDEEDSICSNKSTLEETSCTLAPLNKSAESCTKEHTWCNTVSTMNSTLTSCSISRVTMSVVHTFYGLWFLELLPPVFILILCITSTLPSFCVGSAPVSTYSLG